MTRRLLAGLVCVLGCVSLAFWDDLSSSRKRSPNVVLIIADQMRGDALGRLGHADIRTPNLDKMAKNGVLFERFFCQQPGMRPISDVTAQWSLPLHARVHF